MYNTSSYTHIEKIVLGIINSYYLMMVQIRIKYKIDEIYVLLSICVMCESFVLPIFGLENMI